MTNITSPRFADPDAAREHLESLLWPQGPFCPHCGSVKFTRLPDIRGKVSKKHPEGAIRKGVIQCNDCRDQYTVTVGTVFESSKVPLNKWVLASYLLGASKKGMSAHQLHRMLGVTYKTAWFMAHRLREAMKSNDPDQFGEGGGIVEVDETYIGREAGRKKAPGSAHKMKVLALVDRSTGRSRAVVLDQITIKDLRPVMTHNLSREAHLMTDEATVYGAFGPGFASHGTVNHSKLEFGRGIIHTNTVEGYFSIFKRGMKGVYQHCAKKHLHRYLAEFDFRYSHRIATGYDDIARAAMILKGISGRRLMYRAAVG